MSLYLASNAAALLLVVIAWWWPTVARALISILFLGAAFANVDIATHHPQMYLKFAEQTPIPLYSKIITDAFSRHIVTYVLAISTLQLLISVFVLYKGRLRKLALGGAILFLLAIAPFGEGTAFPSTVILAAACGILLQKRLDKSLTEVIRRRTSGKTII